MSRSLAAPLLMATLPLSAAAGLSGCRPAEPADLLFRGGVLLGAPPGDPAPHWLAVRAGRIAALGSGPAPEARAVVDLNGRVLAPAAVDHHVHLLNVGLSLLNRDGGETLYLDLGGMSSIEEIEAAVARRATALPEGEWIVGKGWSQGAWGGLELPDSTALDRAAPRHPVFLSRVDGHAGWVNGAALEAAGLATGDAEPAGGRILRRAGGEPAGVLLERAAEPVLALLPGPDDATVALAFRRAAEAFAALGVTDVYDAGFLSPPGVVGLQEELERYLRLLAEADAEAPLAVRVRLMIPAPSALAERLVSESAANRRLSPRLEITHLKLFADGALGSRGGWLSHPYADDAGTHGVPRMSAPEIGEWAQRALDAGLDVATHAIGDAAVAAALDAYQELLGERPGLDPGRLRIEHFSYAAREDFARAAELGIVLSIQPGFVYPDDAGRAMEDDRIGAASDRVYAWGRLQRFGARLAGGSDYFSAPVHPMAGFHAAAYRSNERGLPAGGWHGEERLEPDAAWSLFTTLHPPGGGAPWCRELAPGAAADLVVLSADPLTADETALPGIAVHATFRDGEATFHDGSLAGLDAGSAASFAEGAPRRE